MGLPAAGIYSLYRNSMQDVLKYFKKYHKSKVKFYNLCNDSFVDTNQLTAKDNKKVKVAYFPMMDHNPGPLSYIFKFCLDVSLFLAEDPKNVIAVHCKAGKGRTGVVISSYFLFAEACGYAKDAIDLFNTRRTSDGKGLGIPSQKRYIRYFNDFL
jgi:phosphatidylinositol-3,4,5-trisphosphate 3-phosphatase/dual-specificity protein phosphatase PTEN